MRILKGSVSKITFICSLSILRPNLLVRLFNGSKAALRAAAGVKNIQSFRTDTGASISGRLAMEHGYWKHASEQMVQEYLEHHRHPSNAPQRQLSAGPKRTFSLAQTSALSVQSMILGFLMPRLLTLKANQLARQ